MKSCKIFFVFIILIFISKSTFAYEDNEINELPPLDVLILVDVSGSMRFIDPYREVLESIADFVGGFTYGETRVGVIGFSGQVQYNLPFRLVNNASEILEIQNEIINFHYMGFTDIGIALKIMTELLLNEESLTNPMVIIVSDWWIQTDPQHEERTLEDLINDAELAVARLEGLVPIYTIAINNPFGMDTELFSLITRRSNGFASVVNYVGDLQEVFLHILDVHVARIPVYAEVIYEENYNNEDVEYEENYTLDYGNEHEEENDEPIREPLGDGFYYAFAIFLTITASAGVIIFVKTVIR